MWDFLDIVGFFLFLIFGAVVGMFILEWISDRKEGKEQQVQDRDQQAELKKFINGPPNYKGIVKDIRFSDKLTQVILESGQTFCFKTMCLSTIKLGNYFEFWTTCWEEDNLYEIPELCNINERKSKNPSRGGD